MAIAAHAIRGTLTLLVLFTISIGLCAQPGYEHAPVNSRSNSGDYNVQLLHLSDSAMKKIFGELGFSQNFILTCIQNPCEKGYFYANVLESNRPCAMAPQDTCKEAIITYRYANADVPLTIKMVVAMKENGNYIHIENNQYGKSSISFEKQSILTTVEIQEILTAKYPKDSLVLLPHDNTLVYSYAYTFQNLKNQDPSDSSSGIKLIKETKDGENWQSGFIYTARSTNPKFEKRSYHFDALTGKLLYITAFYNVTNRD
jgi:hypothetical protein